MKKASLTVFVSLSLSILLGFVLYATEIAIRNSQRVVFESAADIAMDSVMGEYSVPLWERYGLFYIDPTYLTKEAEFSNVTEHLRFYMEANTTDRAALPQSPWGNVTTREVTLCSYETAAAGGGRSVCNQAVAYMEQNEEGAADVATAQQAVGAFTAQCPTDELERFRAVMEQLAAMELPVVEREDGTKEEIPLSNPADYVYGLVGSDVLYLCGQELSSVHTLQTDRAELPSVRGLQNEQYGDRSFRDDTGLFYGYLLSEFGNYRTVREQSVLDCQLEYLLSGAGSDQENLRECAEQIFLWRMWDNTRLAMADGALYEEAAGYADQLQAVILKAEFREPVIQSILYACAFLESISDVRILLEGGTVALHKSAHQMRAACVADGVIYQGASEDGGLSYEQYVLGMLSLTDQALLRLRMLDLIEMDIRSVSANGNFRIDCCIERLETEITASGALGRTYEAHRKYGYY